MVGEPVDRPPEPGFDPAGGDRASVPHELVSGLVRERMVYTDLPLHGSLSAEAQIASGIDDERRVAAQALGGEVRRQTLSTATGVDPDPGRPRHDPGDRIDGNAAPARVRPGSGGLSLGGDRQGIANPGGGKGGARGGGARVLELAYQRGVDEAIGATRGPEGRVDRGREGWTDRAALAGLGVQRAELA